jgi:hypothetical protein
VRSRVGCADIVRKRVGWADIVRKRVGWAYAGVPNWSRGVAVWQLDVRVSAVDGRKAYATAPKWPRHSAVWQLNVWAGSAYAPITGDDGGSPHTALVGLRQSGRQPVTGWRPLFRPQPSRLSWPSAAAHSRRAQPPRTAAAHSRRAQPPRTAAAHSRRPPQPAPATAGTRHSRHPPQPPPATAGTCGCPPRHSQRSAFTGSRLAARSAGMKPAPNAKMPSTTAAASTTMGSMVLTP